MLLEVCRGIAWGLSGKGWAGVLGLVDWCGAGVMGREGLVGAGGGEAAGGREDNMEGAAGAKV